MAQHPDQTNRLFTVTARSRVARRDPVSWTDGESLTGAVLGSAPGIAPATRRVNGGGRPATLLVRHPYFIVIPVRGDALPAASGRRRARPVSPADPREQ